GEIPASVTNLAFISPAYFDSNFLQGKIPFPVNPGDMPMLGFLRLHNNQLTRKIPPNFKHLYSLLTLAIYRNCKSCIPKSVGKLSNHILSSSSRNVVPEEFVIPQSFIQQSNPSINPEAARRVSISLLDFTSKELDLSDKSLTGSILAWVVNLTELYSLNLPRNSLTLDIPDMITNLHNLGNIDLHSYNLLRSMQKIFELDTRFNEEAIYG
ncbi:Leucine-rich repeat receptor-like serine/threonine-protein kinase BAM1, partial [Bienertia sinuspersici]